MMFGLEEKREETVTVAIIYSPNKYEKLNLCKFWKRLPSIGDKKTRNSFLICDLNKYVESRKKPITNNN